RSVRRRVADHPDRRRAARDAGTDDGRDRRRPAGRRGPDGILTVERMPAPDPRMDPLTRLLVWSVDETVGVDAAGPVLAGAPLEATGGATGQRPEPYTLDYRLETDDAFVTRRLAVRVRTAAGTATLDLRRDEGVWTVDGRARPDLDDALDCDLAACPLTNTM